VNYSITKHQAKVTGTISCFDRILFKGHLPLGWADAMERFMARQGLRLKDFGGFVIRQSSCSTSGGGGDQADPLTHPAAFRAPRRVRTAADP
jgi:hypothetical protein